MGSIKVGVDPGNNRAKVVGPFGYSKYNTSLCGWFERDVEEDFGEDDLEFDFGKRRGFAGPIAEAEDEFGAANVYGDTKAHEDAKIRTVLSLFKYSQRYCPGQNHFSIVTNQPIKQYKKSEKEKIIHMLQREHNFKVNGDSYTIYIDRVGVSPEGSVAIWNVRQSGKVRIIDIGSGTVNAATLIDKKHVNTGSDTFNFGLETLRNKNDLSSFSRGIIAKLTQMKWHKDDLVYVCGGISEEIYPYIKDYFSRAEVMRPRFKVCGASATIQTLHPVYANANASYEIAKVKL